METLRQELDLALPEPAALIVVTVRLVLAAALGGLLGYERESQGKAAGLRTHMLVAMGSALFVIAAVQSGASPGDLTRVLQGIATGIGFVGAGTILKRPAEGDVQGLTTAAGVWLTAAVGVAVGVGRLWLPVVGAVLAMGILRGLQRWTHAAAAPATIVDPSADRRR